MATCKDCLHSFVCWKSMQVEKDNLPCSDFADRSLYMVREKGEWVYDHWCEFKCSKCGALSKTEPRGEENFCPNCGSDMRAKDGEDDG